VIYFSSRPSAISYNPLPSGGSNWGLTNNKLKDNVNNRENHFISYNQTTGSSEIPSEMLFSSASGLDPHISPRSALLQADRISNARHFDSSQKEKLIQCIRSRTEKPQFLILGEERVNVLLLNLDIDKIK
jgi:K+-transporting ATPase ATPase C chain